MSSTPHMTEDPTTNREPAPRGGESVPGRVWTSTALLSGARLWATACTAVVLLVLARHLTGAEFGRYTFYLALFLVLDCLADFGTATAAVQRSGGELRHLPASIAAAVPIRWVTAALCYGLVLAAVAFETKGGGTWLLLGGLYCFSRIAEVRAVVFHGEIRWGVPVAVRTITATGRVVGALLLVQAECSAFGPYLVVHLGLLAFGNAVLFVVAGRRLARLGSASKTMRPTELLATAAPLGIAAICQQAYFYVDNLFVRAIRGDEELGYYNAAVRVMSFLVLVAIHATTVALPWLARRHRGGVLGDATRRLTLPLFLVACLVLGALWPWCDVVLKTLFGPDFVDAAPSLRWLVAAAAVIYAGAGWLTAVVAAGRVRAVLGLTLGALVVNLVGNAWLVPIRGMEGAAIATVATEVLVALGALSLLRRAAGSGAPRPVAWLAGIALFAAAAWLSGLAA